MPGEGVNPSQTNISKIMSWAKPKTSKQIKQLVAMGSYYQQCVKTFASIIRPMIELTRKGKKFPWTEACDLSFDQMSLAECRRNVIPIRQSG